MNIDERIEALTQSMELLSHHAQGTDRRLDRIADFLDRLGRIVENPRTSPF